MADVLMPVACARAGTWARGQACVDRARGEPVRVYPPLREEPEAVQGTPAAIYFMMSNTTDPGLLMPGFNETAPVVSRPFLGFGVVGTANGVRFTDVGRQRLEAGADDSCRSKGCRGFSTERMQTLRVREVSATTASLAANTLDDTLASKVPQRPPTQKASSITVLVSGREEQVIALQLNLPSREGMPFEDDFLVAQRGDVFRHLVTVGAYTDGMGETGELLAAVDLDGDGTDELLLEWSYSGGRWYRLVRRSGEQLIVLGEFGDGC
jgi:hypothetical protein